jgi:hypothetical protein
VVAVSLAYIVYRFVSALVSLLVLAGIVVLIYFYITQPNETMLVFQYVSSRMSAYV